MSRSSLLAPHHDVAKQKADSTLRYSQAVPDPSTNQALSRSTSEVRRDPVHSTWYGRQRISTCDIHCLTLFLFELLGSLASAPAACILKGGWQDDVVGPHTKSASSVAATYRPPMLVPRVRLPAGAFHVCAKKWVLPHFHPTFWCFKKVVKYGVFGANLQFT